MSRELEEALEYLQDVVYTFDNEQELIDKAFELIKQTLTPPTADEVCQALSEYYNSPMYYEKTKYKDGFHNGNVYAIMYENGEIKFTTKYFNAKLPPHIIEMLGAFYKEELRKNEQRKEKKNN